MEEKKLIYLVLKSIIYLLVCREHEKELFRKIIKKEMMNKQEDAISASNE